MKVPRRGVVLGGAALAAMVGLAVAEAADTQTLPLWPGVPPGGPGPAGSEDVNADGAVANVLTPRMIMSRPSKPNGAAVLIVPGGGYRRISVAKEGMTTALWLNGLGVTAFTLVYRLPNSGWAGIAPFQDAQRAMRLIRHQAEALGIDATRLGILGYSAGGNLAGITAMRSAASLYPPIDTADSLSARPDFVGLVYPVVTLFPPFATKVSTATLVGDAPTEAQRAAFSVERQVTRQAPPVFLAHADDDPIAPVENSLMLFSALRAAQVQAAMHIFQTGRHGFNLGRTSSEVSAWPALFAKWANLA